MPDHYKARRCRNPRRLHFRHVLLPIRICLHSKERMPVLEIISANAVVLGDRQFLAQAGSLEQVTKLLSLFRITKRLDLTSHQNKSLLPGLLDIPRRSGLRCDAGEAGLRPLARFR